MRRRIFSAEASGEISESSESESESESSGDGEDVAECSSLSAGIMPIASRMSTCYESHHKGDLYFGSGR